MTAGRMCRYSSCVVNDSVTVAAACPELSSRLLGDDPAEMTVVGLHKNGGCLRAQ